MKRLPQIRSVVRATVNRARCNAVPVIIVPGKLGPQLTGERGGHFTRGGTPIAHPGAYARFGWSNMVYRTSTECIRVGAAWIAEHVLTSPDDQALAIAFREVSSALS